MLLSSTNPGIALGGLWIRLRSAVAGALLGLRAVRNGTQARSTADRSAPDAADPSSRTEMPALDELRRRLGDGDAQAFEQIFRRLSEPIFRYVCGMVSDEALADDLTQDTFAKLWSIRDRMDEIDSLRSYLFQMARNRVYNHHRETRTRRDNRAQLKEDTSGTSSAVPPDQSLDAELFRSLLEQWIEELPARQREALTLRRQEDLGHEEIADIMDIAPSTVNNHLTRAMKRLRDRLREHRSDLPS